MTDALLEAGPNASDVAAYLRQHPQFLNEYPELAAQLTMPRAQGAVTSLAMYQLQGLRDKNAELERRLGELAAIATENEQLMQRVHDLNVTVLRAPTPEAAACSVIEKLDADFHSGPVRLLLFGSALALAPAPWLLRVSGATAVPEFADLLSQHEPITGRLSIARLERLFGAQVEEVRSAAVMPLDDLGLLAIGSTDPDHFQPGMGTLFLKMIAATVTAALRRTATA